MDQLADTAQGAIGYAVAAIVVGWQAFQKWRSETRGDNREIDRLLRALADERNVNKELRQQRNDAWEARDAANDRNNEMFRELADLKASNARLEMRVQYLAEQLDYMRARLK